MSNDALNWAWKSGLAPGPRFVLVALADQGAEHSGEDWTCFPSVAFIMARTGFSRAAVERHLKFLTVDRWIMRARRRRSDGTLGIYDFTLRRDRPAEGPAGAFVDGAKAAEPAEPCLNLTYGEGDPPCVNLSETTRQIDAQPYVNLRGQEPLGEPLDKPSPRAREPGDDGFEAVFDAYEARGRARTDRPMARAAYALQRQAASADLLLSAVRRYVAEDHDLANGDHGAPSLERWLAGERWRAWASGIEGADEVAGPPRFADPGIRAALVGFADERFVRSYLDPAAWDAETRTVRAATGPAFAKLSEIAAAFFRPLDITLIPPHGATSR